MGLAYGDVAMLESLRRTPLSETPTIKAPNAVSGLLLDFLQHHIGRGIKSFAWAKEVEEMLFLGDGK